jgi:hypothetical protein
LVGAEVQHGLGDTEALVEHALGVRDVVGHGQWRLGEVSLQEKVALGVRAVESAVNCRAQGQGLAQLGVQFVFVVTDG